MSNNFGSWYVGKMSAKEAEGLLKSDGAFLVRKSINSGLYTLTLYSNCLTPPIRHFPITIHSSGQFSLSGGARYDTLYEFVEYHQKCKGSLPTLLKSYPSGTPACLKSETSVRKGYPSGTPACLKSETSVRKSTHNSFASGDQEASVRKSTHNSFASGDQEASVRKSTHNSFASGDHSSKGSTRGSSTGSRRGQLLSSELKIGGKLGSGTLGSVCHGSLSNGKTVAVKVIEEGTMSKDEVIKDAERISSLQHPNLVQCYGVCTDQRPIYIVNEYMKDGNLVNYLGHRKHDLMANSRRLVAFCAQICAGMAYLERHNFVHRDLAARNCLVDGHTVKVGDFGLMRCVNSNVYQGRHGAPFPVRNSAPEVIRSRKFTSKSDVWSFGVLMWQMFSFGKQPYSAMSDEQVMSHVASGKSLKPPETCNEKIATIMSDCFKPNPADRPTFTDISNKLKTL